MSSSSQEQPPPLWEDHLIRDEGFLQISRRPREYQWVLDNLPKPPARLFEIGCGRGEVGIPDSMHVSQISKMVLYRGYSLAGYDLHDITWNHPNFEYRKYNFLAPEIKQEEFDAGFSIQVISHIGMQYFTGKNEPFDIDADYRVWKKIAKILKKDGVFITGMPIAKEFTTFYPKILPKDKGRIYDEKRLSDVLDKAGLVLEKQVLYEGWNPKFEDKPISSIKENAPNLMLLVVRKP